MTSTQQLQVLQTGVRNIRLMREEIHSTVTLLAGLINTKPGSDYFRIGDAIECGPFPCKWLIKYNKYKQIVIESWIKVRDSEQVRVSYNSQDGSGDNMPLELVQETWQGLPILFENCLRTFPYLEKSIDPYLQAARMFEK